MSLSKIDMDNLSKARLRELSAEYSRLKELYDNFQSGDSGREQLETFANQMKLIDKQIDIKLNILNRDLLLLLLVYALFTVYLFIVDHIEIPKATLLYFALFASFPLIRFFSIKLLGLHAYKRWFK